MHSLADISLPPSWPAPAQMETPDRLEKPMTATTNNILRIDASMRRTGSVTRALTDKLVARLRTVSPGSEVIRRDLADGVPQVDEAWIGANFTDPAERDDAQRAALAESDELVAELKAADTLVIGLPIYNFGVPAAFK